MHVLTVRDLPLAERPRERLIQQGVEVLSVQELLAVVLGRGVRGMSVIGMSQQLLHRFHSLEGLAAASIEELAEVQGMGRAKAAQLCAVLELSRRLRQERSSLTGQELSTPELVNEYLRPWLEGRKTERCVLIMLDARNRPLRVTEISSGGLTTSMVHPREVFGEAVAARAHAVIVAHNHPSGDSTPSEADITLTLRLIAAGQLLGIPVLDHVIVGKGQLVSLKRFGVFDVRNEDGHAIC